MSVSDAYLAATVNAAAVGEASRREGFINMSQMTVSQMSITETTPSPQHKAALPRRAGAELVRSAGCARAADSVSRRLLPDFDSGFQSGNRSDQLPFGEGKTSPVQGKTLPRVIAAAASQSQPHIARSIT